MGVFRKAKPYKKLLEKQKEHHNLDLGDDGIDADGHYDETKDRTSLKRMKRELSPKYGRLFKYILVSIDPVRDTPNNLKKYAEKQGLKSPTWTLLTGNSDSVLELAAVLGVKFKKLKAGGYNHSNIIHFLNKDGVVFYQQVGLNQDPALAIEKIIESGG